MKNLRLRAMRHRSTENLHMASRYLSAIFSVFIVNNVYFGQIFCLCHQSTSSPDFSWYILKNNPVNDSYIPSVECSCDEYGYTILLHFTNN